MTVELTLAGNLVSEDGARSVATASRNPGPIAQLIGVGALPAPAAIRDRQQGGRG